MEYNIHLHLPNGAEQSVSSNAHSGTTAEAPRKPGAWHESFMDRVKQCYNWRSLYELAEDFHKVGLTIHDTSDGRRVLCRLEEGKPITERIIDDYIFVGSKLSIDEEVSQRAMEVIMHFVEASSGEPQNVVTDEQSYSRHMALYGDPLAIYPEDTARPSPLPNIPSPPANTVQPAGNDNNHHAGIGLQPLERHNVHQEIELMSRLL